MTHSEGERHEKPLTRLHARLFFQQHTCWSRVQARQQEARKTWLGRLSSTGYWVWGIDAVLLAVLTVLFFWPILTPVVADRGSFPAGDFANQFYAFSVFEAREWQAGRVPLWSPYAYAGFPFQADIQSAIFYPPSLVTMLLTLRRGFTFFALELEAVAHFFLAGLFTYLFARRLLTHRLPALVVAITFTFGGYLTAYPPLQLAILETDVWLPLILLLINMGMDGRQGQGAVNYPHLLLAGLVLGIGYLAGHPQSAMYVVYTSLLYLAWRGNASARSSLAKHPLTDGGSRRIGCLRADALGWHPRPPMSGGCPRQRGLGGWCRLAAAAVIFLAVGAGLAAVQLIPSFEYMRLSTRAQASYEQLANGFPLRDVLQVILPGSVSLWSPLYVGVLPLLLAGLGLVRRKDREPVFWGALGLVALLLSFGGNTFVYRLFYLLVPGFNLFQSQERAAFIVSFALAVLAGYGVCALDRETARRLMRWALALAALGALLLAGFYLGWVRDGLRADSPFAGQVSRATFLLLVAGLSAVILRLWGRPVAPLLALGLITFDLFTVNSGINFQQKPPERHYAPRPLVEPMQRDPDVFRVFNEYRIAGNYGLVYGVEDLGGGSPLEIQRYHDLVEALPQERLWELLNVKYVITWRGSLPGAELIYQEPKGDEMTYLYRLNTVGPRAWVVHQTEVIPDDSMALARLADPAFDPRRVALLAEPVALDDVPARSSNKRVVERTSERAGASDAPAATSQVGLVERLPGRLVLDVDAGADGLLVLAEVYYPGWRAKVDGQYAPVLRADYTLRAVPVPAGRHRVELVFDPLSFKVGLVISGLTLLTVAGWLAWGKLAVQEANEGT